MESKNELGLPLCGCTPPDKHGDYLLCARHFVLCWRDEHGNDGKGEVITFDKPVVAPHLGRAIEKITQRKGRR
jgi:hypothetical protein